MALNIIGIGLNDEKDITLKGLELVKNSDEVYLESYTSKLQCEISELEKLYGKKVNLANREIVEQKAEDVLLNPAKEKNVSLLIIGDVFAATTHVDLMLRAKQSGIKVNIVHNASVLTAIGITGLSLYKFGKTTSIPFENENVETPYNVIKENNKMHTLILLDLRPEENRFMKFTEARDFLLKIESKRKENVFTEDTLCVGCAKLGSTEPVIQVRKAKELEEVEAHPQCLIVPGEMHFMEEEFLMK
ncbi:diphthine synthase [Candidatus Woesearchaeota archaeon]|nr:MAG: diphthine synthase [Candidatus Woesearchaeota archaeon]